MGNIKLYLNVRLIEHSMWDFSDKNEKAVLYPFKSVEIFAKEIHICPFCGKAVEDFNCNCKDFGEAFMNLQNGYGDNEHKSQLHSCRSTLVLSKLISDLQFRTLEKKETLGLEEIFWDPKGTTDQQEDSLKVRCYKVSPVNYDGKNYFFICEDLISKSVYRFDVPAIRYKARRIYLSIKRKRASKVKVLNNAQPAKYYSEDLAEFENWNYLCHYLRSYKGSTSD